MLPTDALLRCGSMDPFKGRGLYLDYPELGYMWEVAKDNEGCFVLIQRRKE